MSKYSVATSVIGILIVIGVVAVIAHQRKDDPASTAATPTPTISDTATPVSDATATATAQVTNSVNVTINNYAFSPTTLSVTKGTTVTWTNEDSVAHTVTAVGGTAGPSSSLLSTGQSYSYTFNQVGTFAYVCTVHSNMAASVTVTE